RAVVLLDPRLHLLEQLVEQALMFRLPAVEISVLLREIRQHAGIIDVRIFWIAQPVPRVFDGHSMAFVAVGALLGLRRGGNLDGLVHSGVLARRAGTE